MMNLPVERDDLFSRTVDQYMTRALVTADPSTPVHELAKTMQERRISAIPILDAERHLVGVVAQTDLIALGAIQSGRRGESPAMPLPTRVARDVMIFDPIAVPSRASIRVAAQAMACHAIHRVYVVDRGTLVGVLGTVDIATIVCDAHVSRPLSSVMSTPPVMIDVMTPLGSAVEMLSSLRVSGLVVTANDVPVGTFTQNDALAARELPRGTPVEAVYEPALVCLPAHTPLNVAAAQLARMDVRRVVVCEHRTPVGVATALDLVRYVAWWSSVSSASRTAVSSATLTGLVK